MHKHSLVYLCNGIGSVFESQVLELLKEISKREIFSRVILLLGLSDLTRIEPELNITQNGFEVFFFKSYPNFPFTNAMNRWHLRKALGKANLDLQRTIFHTRGELPAWHLSRVIDKKYHQYIIPDIRGASVEEISEYYDFARITKKLKVLNYKRALQNLNTFSKVSCVSDSCKEYLVTQYSLHKGKIAVIPCLAGKNFKFSYEKRAYRRNELKLDGDDILVVFSSGGAAKWQQNAFLRIIANRGLKVLNLSKNEIVHENSINKFVRYSEMAGYLCAADIGIIWRDKSIVNQVASPVKFSEYICCGLPVFANKSVMSIADFINRNKTGFLIDNFADITETIIDSIAKLDRHKIASIGYNSFSRENIVNKYMKLYSKL